jgi:hypothetical protein
VFNTQLFCLVGGEDEVDRYEPSPTKPNESGCVNRRINNDTTVKVKQREK